MALKLLNEACNNVASDIYIFPHDNGYSIEARVNDGCFIIAKYTLNETISIINFLKFNGGLNVSEQRRPQKGSFSFLFSNHNIHIRISTVGDFMNRESVVIRLIYPQEMCNQVNQEIIDTLLPVARLKGMMIFSGPMGSGKTSLMYALSRELVNNKKVMCIEDPIEIVEDKFLQLQVNAESKMTYEELIKTSLRHRPEVLIIGEIRDSQTAKLAVQAALYGYTVMTTIHGKSKYTVVQRLRQFGIDDFEITNSINMISYQRLIPVVNGTELLVDTLDNTGIKEFISNEKTDDNWQEMLKNTRQNGYIDENTYQEYLFG
ncbi:Flp pilus assembly complex ATPase component TadA [Companilactobacillus allii]|uniref:Competence protein n=1 Tax=Companilactobacillus allii TaxID=1847728 RepID=A0A1P8Q3D7_9LACO|nr:competence type IV pilus ATPase ComGA [Companilactobacillus allii]APX72384.1 competence protein [Companilactobacillus allii]USQ69477.1 Flp pilus assembly complex ATPase component TadA [Companilactobacillus allii]